MTVRGYPKMDSNKNGVYGFSSLFPPCVFFGHKDSKPPRVNSGMRRHYSLTKHTSLEVSVGQKKKNFWYHLSGVVVDLLEVRFLPLGKKTIQPFSRAGGIQAKWPAKYGLNGLCVLTAISEKAGCFLCR